MPVPKLDLMANEYLMMASVGSLVVSFIAIYTPLSKIFGMSMISIVDWGIAMLTSLIVIIALDVVKILNQRYHFLNYSS